MPDLDDRFAALGHLLPQNGPTLQAVRQRAKRRRRVRMTAGGLSIVAIIAAAAITVVSLHGTGRSVTVKSAGQPPAAGIPASSIPAASIAFDDLVVSLRSIPPGYVASPRGCCGGDTIAALLSLTPAAGSSSQDALVLGSMQVAIARSTTTAPILRAQEANDPDAVLRAWRGHEPATASREPPTPRVERHADRLWLMQPGWDAAPGVGDLPDKIYATWTTAVDASHVLQVTATIQPAAAVDALFSSLQVSTGQHDRLVTTNAADPTPLALRLDTRQLKPDRFAGTATAPLADGRTAATITVEVGQHPGGYGVSLVDVPYSAALQQALDDTDTAALATVLTSLLRIPISSVTVLGNDAVATAILSGQPVDGAPVPRSAWAAEADTTGLLLIRPVDGSHLLEVPSSQNTRDELLDLLHQVELDPIRPG